VDKNKMKSGKEINVENVTGKMRKVIREDDKKKSLICWIPSDFYIYECTNFKGIF
jgi:hypothetical protein